MPTMVTTWAKTPKERIPRLKASLKKTLQAHIYTFIALAVQDARLLAAVLETSAQMRTHQDERAHAGRPLVAPAALLEDNHEEQDDECAWIHAGTGEVLLCRGRLGTGGL